MSAIQIRSMRIGDYNAVISLWERIEGISKRSADSRENICRYLDRNPDLSLVAIDGDHIIGTVLVGHDGRRAYIYHLAVKPSYRRQGIAAQIEAEIVHRLKAIGIEKSFIWVFGEVIEVHVAGVAFVPHAGNADLGLVHVFSCHAGAKKHGLRSALRFGLGYRF